MATESGTIGHAEIRIGDTIVLAFDRAPEWPVMPSLLRVWVPNADGAFEKAVAAGAFGQRGGRVKDPFGNIWWS